MNQLDMQGRVAVVTGGARGIGRAVAERMLASGATVSLWDLDARALEATAAELSRAGTVSTQAVELTDEALDELVGSGGGVQPQGSCCWGSCGHRRRRPR